MIILVVIKEYIENGINNKNPKTFTIAVICNGLSLVDTCFAKIVNSASEITAHRIRAFPNILAEFGDTIPSTSIEIKVIPKKASAMEIELYKFSFSLRKKMAIRAMHAGVVLVIIPAEMAEVYRTP
ncbi:hypothetical protein SAMN05446037_101244 [Anaerovirgula multivorans]|uniref:Uncharacterized protein n=1 Tax=Anaerovirgula multivorans TaxID=312168 RepID=A0A239F6R6_9FIRM|nr:hypothetical protein SAMN05446037_101244 [Anaerovirgula multivorans]